MAARNLVALRLQYCKASSKAVPHFVTFSKLSLLAASLAASLAAVLTNCWSRLTSHTLCREAQGVACETTVGPGLKCDW